MTLHRAFTNASFALDGLTMRLLVHMLSVIGPGDETFTTCLTPVKKLMNGSRSHNGYGHIRQRIKELEGCALVIEEPESGIHWQQYDLVLAKLFDFVHYAPKKGVVRARFNSDLATLLLHPQQQVIEACVAELQRIRSPAALRIYLLLLEYATAGERVFLVEELQQLLGLERAYVGRFDNLKSRILDRAQQELAVTSLPFTYQPIQQGRRVVSVRFLFAKRRTDKHKRLSSGL